MWWALLQGLHVFAEFLKVRAVVQVDEQHLDGIPGDGLGDVLQHLVGHQGGLGIILNLRILPLAEYAVVGVGLGMQAELVSLVEGLPDAASVHAGLEDGLPGVRVVDQRAVGGDGIAAGLVHVKLLQLERWCCIRGGRW